MQEAWALRRGAEAAGISDIGALHTRDRVKAKPLDAVAPQYRDFFREEGAHPPRRHVRRPVRFQIPRSGRLLDQLGSIVVAEARRRQRPAAVIGGNGLADRCAVPQKPDMADVKGQLADDFARQRKALKEAQAIGTRQPA